MSCYKNRASGLRLEVERGDLKVLKAVSFHQSLTFSGEDGQVMKDKLVALIDRELSKKSKGYPTG